MRSIQQALRAGRPLWLKTATAQAQRYRALSGHHETAVAIVGGGMTGALIAHAFAAAGIETILLERRSAYLMARDARQFYEHHIPPVTEQRYSVTFRTLR